MASVESLAKMAIVTRCLPLSCHAPKDDYTAERNDLLIFLVSSKKILVFFVNFTPHEAKIISGSRWSFYKLLSALNALFNA
jgi:hypothetical protein